MTRGLACTVLAGALTLVLAPPASASLTSGLQGYWRFEGSGADASGQGRDVTLSGGAGYSAGLLGQGLSLDGVNGSHAARPGSDAVFDLPGDFSIQVWVNPAETVREQTLIEKFSSSSGPGWTLTYLGGQFFASGVGAPINLGSTPGVITANAWHHVLLTRQGSLFSMFFDGVAALTGVAGGTINPSGNPLLIGARNAGDGRNFTLNGVLDEVAIWDRALTTDEVQALWNNGAGTVIGGEAPTGVPAPAGAALLLGAIGALAAVRGRRAA